MACIHSETDWEKLQSENKKIGNIIQGVVNNINSDRYAFFMQTPRIEDSSKVEELVSTLSEQFPGYRFRYNDNGSSPFMGPFIEVGRT